MKTNRFFILFFFLLVIFTKGYSDDNLFKKRLKNAKKGDFIIYEYNKLYSCLCVFEINLENNKITLEEITIPKTNFNKKISFREWIEKKAKGSTSWTLYEIDLINNKIIDTYSVLRECFMDLNDQVSIVAKLLELKLNKLKDSDRKKIGPPSLEEVDKRALWNPPKYVDGKRIKRAKFDVYRSIWPDDSSELSLKRFDIYFDDDFVFPYFIEINNGHMSYMIKALDSGRDLNSFISFFPKRKAMIIDIKKRDNILTILVKNASQYKNFNLYTIDVSKEKKMICSLDHEIKKENELVFFNINLKNFNEIFKKNHKYRFIITSSNARDIYIESKDIVIFK